MLCQVAPWHVIYYHVMPCHGMPCHVRRWLPFWILLVAILDFAGSQVIKYNAVPPIRSDFPDHGPDTDFFEEIGPCLVEI